MEQLQKRLDAPGDFAQAYIVAHEIGHHVQSLLGVMEDVDLATQENPDDRTSSRSGSAAGRLPRRDLGHSAYAKGDLLETGDLEEGLNAAAAVGDDRIQQQSGQGVDPEAFTHGTSAQRVKWFRAGFDSGDPTACNTFEGEL